MNQEMCNFEQWLAKPCQPMASKHKCSSDWWRKRKTSQDMQRTSQNIPEQSVSMHIAVLYVRCSLWSMIYIYMYISVLYNIIYNIIYIATKIITKSQNYAAIFSLKRSLCRFCMKQVCKSGWQKGIIPLLRALLASASQPSNNTKNIQ
jgi:hypothetical protein